MRSTPSNYIDLYQLHRPDPTIEVEETASALEATCPVRRREGTSWGGAPRPGPVTAGDRLISPADGHPPPPGALAAARLPRGISILPLRRSDVYSNECGK